MKSKAKECCAVVLNIRNMRYMADYFLRKKKYIFFVTHTLIIVLNVVIFGLGVSILSSMRASASIAWFNFMDGGVTLYGIYLGVIFLGSFQLLFLLYFKSRHSWIFSELDESCFWKFSNTNFILNFIFNLMVEALFFKFVSCFNFANNSIVIARSSLVISLQLIMLGSIIPFMKALKKEFDTHLGSRCVKIFYTIFPSIVMIALNGVLIARLKPQLIYNIEPSSYTLNK
jgi:hypothetical protein